LRRNRWAATVAPVDHQPLRRLITPDRFGDKSLKIKPNVIGQAFFEKGCAATVAPVDHADRVLEIRLSNPNVTPQPLRRLITPIGFWK